MRENLLLFNGELDKLKETGWGYEIIYQDERKKSIWLRLKCLRKSGGICIIRNNLPLVFSGKKPGR